MKRTGIRSKASVDKRLFASLLFIATISVTLPAAAQTGDDFLAVFDRGREAALAGKFEDALKDLNVVVEALSNKPQSENIDVAMGAALAFRASAKRGLNDYKGAEEDFTAVLDIDKNPTTRAVNLLWRAKTRMILKDFKGSVADWTAYLDLETDPVKQAIALNERGVAWQQLKEIKKAVDDYDAAVKLDTNHAPSYMNRGQMQYAMGEYAKSVADFDEAIRLSPKMAIAYNARAFARATCPDEQIRDGEKAMADADQATTLSNNVGYFNTLAAAYAEAGKFNEALGIIEKLIEMMPSDDLKNALRPHLNLYNEKKPLRFDPTLANPLLP